MRFVVCTIYKTHDIFKVSVHSVVMRMAWPCHVLTLLTLCVTGTEATCQFNRNCTDFSTTTTWPYSTNAPSDDKNFSSVWSTYQVAFFFGVFILILGILCVIVVKRKAAMRDHSQQQDRQCGLMTAAIYDILSQSRRTPNPDLESGESPEAVHPVKPPSYDEVTKDSSLPQAPPPSYRESLRQSLNDYPQHFCQHPKY